MTSDNWRKFKRLRNDPTAPIFVQNISDMLMSWTVYADDWRVERAHRNRDLRDLRIYPSEIVNLRDLLHEDAFSNSQTIYWLISTERLIVLNDHYGNSSDPFEDEEIKPILEAMKNPPIQRTARYYAIAAQRSRNERRNFR